MRPADSWHDFKRRFAEYRLQPSPTNMSPRPFTPSGDRLRKAYLGLYLRNAKPAVERVSTAVDALLAARLLPSRPSAVRQAHVRRIVKAVRSKRVRPSPGLRTFWEALVLYREGYRCRYCGRRPEDVLAETKGIRSLRLVVDHCI